MIEMSTPFEDTLEFDTALILGSVCGPAVDVVLVDPEGGEHNLRAMYEAPGNTVSPGAVHAPVVSTAPMLHVQESAIQNAVGRPLSRRDRFIVRGASYAVQNPQTDGYGLLSVKLLETVDA
jgi:hypothetical protein